MSVEQWVQYSAGVLSYQWESSLNENTWTNISSNQSLTITNDLEGTNVRSKISYIDDVGFNEQITTSSIYIPYVDDGDAEFSIFGEIGIEKVLSINEDSADPDGTGTLSYKWQSPP